MNPQYIGAEKIQYRNRDKVWLIRSAIAFPQDGNNRRYNVCYEVDGEYVALDQIVRRPDGTYFQDDKDLGHIEDDVFEKFMEKLVGVHDVSEEVLFDQVCESYARHGSVPGVMKELGTSKERTRKILITRGLLKNERIENIAFLYDDDGGKGKSLAEIALELGINENTVWKNLAYT